MNVVPVSKDAWEARNEEFIRALGYVEGKVKSVDMKLDSILAILNGNGKPGLRQTQSDLIAMKVNCERQHAELRKQQEERRVEERRVSDRWNGWIMFFLKPFWPYVPPALVFGLLYLLQGYINGR